MQSLTRRSLLAAVAALAASPAQAAPLRRNVRRNETPRTAIDVVIIGAGAAGIAAARKLGAAGRHFVLIEAADRLGGRCITDTTTFDAPYDRGAHWIYLPEINPLAKLATGAGVDIYPAPPGQRMRIGRRYAREGEMEDYLATLVRANSAIADAARGRTDISCEQALPPDLGDWRATIEFVLGPFDCGKELAEVSALDFSHALDRDSAALCRQGYGALLAKLAAAIPLELSTPATRIIWSGRAGVTVETPKGAIEARTAIVTVSTKMLLSGKIRFTPELPKRQLDAANRLRLGSFDHIVLELPGNPLGLRPDELVFEKSSGPRTASIFANISGSSLCMIDVGGKFGRDLSSKGEPEMVAFALDWLADLYGADLRKAVRRTQATRWNSHPWTLGAFSAAAPGGQPSRRVLMEPLNNRLWFAGEAAHETAWGTVGGAWESGERAADAVLKVLSRR